MTSLYLWPTIWNCLVTFSSLWEPLGTSTGHHHERKIRIIAKQSKHINCDSIWMLYGESFSAVACQWLMAGQLGDGSHHTRLLGPPMLGSLVVQMISDEGQIFVKNHSTFCRNAQSAQKQRVEYFGVTNLWARQTCRADKTFMVTVFVPFIVKYKGRASSVFLHTFCLLLLQSWKTLSQLSFCIFPGLLHYRPQRPIFHIWNNPA